MSESEHRLSGVVVPKRHVGFQVTSHNFGICWGFFFAAGAESYHFLLSSGNGHPDHDVFTHVSLGGLPADVQAAGGGVGDLQVPHEAQRPCERGDDT